MEELNQKVSFYLNNKNPKEDCLYVHGFGFTGHSFSFHGSKLKIRFNQNFFDKGCFIPDFILNYYWTIENDLYYTDESANIITHPRLVEILNRLMPPIG